MVAIILKFWNFFMLSSYIFQIVVFYSTMTLKKLLRLLYRILYYQELLIIKIIKTDDLLNKAQFL